MISNKKLKSTFSDKRDQKVIRYFNSKLSKDNNLSKSKKYLVNKDKKLKEDIASQSKNLNIKQNKNKTSTKFITQNETLKKISFKNNNKSKNKEIIDKQLSKKIDDNFISISSISKNNLIVEDKNSNTIINKIEKNSNIQLGSNNKITIIKNIFTRGNKPLSKNKSGQGIKMKIIKIKNRNNYTISDNDKKLRTKKINDGERNKFNKKFFKQSLSTYNSIDNIKKENKYCMTSNNRNIVHFNTISNNLQLSSKIETFKNKLSISLENSKKKIYMNLSHSNFINTLPSLNNCNSDIKLKVKNIKTIKTLSINADNKYKKIYHNIKRKKFQKKINLIRCLNKMVSPRLILKNKFSSTITNNNKNNNQEKDNEKYINNIEAKNKRIIDNSKKKKNNFYEKIKKINLKSVRSNSINVNLNKNTKHKIYNSDINNNNNNNNNSSLMNVRLNNKLYQLKLKNIELSEIKNFKNNRSPSFRNNNIINNKINGNKIHNNKNYYESIHKYINIPIQDDKNKNNSSNLRDKIKIFNEFKKNKDSLSVKNNSKLIKNLPIKKFKTNLKRLDIKNENNEGKNNLEIKEEQIYNNINQNSLTMYSIYILSKYYESFDKIGLSQIFLYDNKNLIIPVLYSNSNSDIDSSNFFFNTSQSIKLNNKQIKYPNIKNQNTPFICEFKQNLYINFFVKNIQSHNINHIKIINYFNKKQKISPSKDIKIYQGNFLLYEGILNIDKPNIIFFDTKNLEKEKNDTKYIDKNIYSTLSTTSRKHFSFINSNNSNLETKLRLNNPENNYNSHESNKSTKNKNIRKCLFYSNESQNELNKNIIINNDFCREQNYVKFEDICIVIISNYGHKEYVGLTGIEFIDNKGKVINIEKAKTIGALPKDLYTIYNDEKEKRIFENIFNGDNNTNDINNMWATKLIENDKDNNSLFSHTYIELSFYEKICLSKIKIYNYNDKNNLDICARELKIFFDTKYYGTIVLRQGIGEKIFDSIDTDNSELNKNNEDYSQDITFPINNIELDKEYIYKHINKNKFSSFLFKQNYEPPYLPCGNIIKFQFNNNYSNRRNKYIFDTNEDLFFKYNVIGINKIEIYDEKGMNILNNNNYKIISNCEILNEDLSISDNKILLNGIQNENGNNCLFYIFNYPVFISYIKIFPLKIKENIYCENTVKDFKIFCDNLIIFEGVMNKSKPSIVYFSSDIKIVSSNNNINKNENCLIQCSKNRTIKEEKNNKYISLTLI